MQHRHEIEDSVPTGLEIIELGDVGGDRLTIELWDHAAHEPFQSAEEILLSDLRKAHESFFPNLMGGEITVA
jgi:hypothetical protein